MDQAKENQRLQGVSQKRIPRKNKHLQANDALYKTLLELDYGQNKAD